ncbi:hypothetical protein AOXY_G7530 [Acipenser oxyrinchus oxyrinchus]|uniref:Uncharacterized protein n=1 Tax=Acipenser oxyrinchus oxyrinchus TaxID=40147 RepID=A0AAD8LN69_ACIOX|nr:hypothetical protein AOXY_G7530 [Acipenser oxyrinchus oxyrinchus]
MNSNQTLAPQSPVSGTLRPRSALRKPAVKKEKRGTDAGNFNLHLLEIINMFTENIHKEVSLTLFADHQLCFTFMICCNIMTTNSSENTILKTTGFLPENEWQTFLHSAALANIMDVKRIIDGASSSSGPPASWLSESMWRQCLYITAHLETFTLLCESLASNPQQWIHVLNAENLYPFFSKHYTSPNISKQSKNTM